MHKWHSIRLILIVLWAILGTACGGGGGSNHQEGNSKVTTGAPATTADTSPTPAPDTGGTPDDPPASDTNPPAPTPDTGDTPVTTGAPATTADTSPKPVPDTGGTPADPPASNTNPSAPTPDTGGTPADPPASNTNPLAPTPDTGGTPADPPTPDTGGTPSDPPTPDTGGTPADPPTTETSPPAPPSVVPLEDFPRTGRETAPVVTPEELQAVASANLSLAMDIYHAYISGSGKEENLIFSPYDISQMLAIITVGARGSTLEAVLNDLQITLPAQRLHPAMNAAGLDMVNRNQTGGFQQHSALWGQGRSLTHQQASYLFSFQFLRILAQHYGPQMTAVDFTNPSIPLATSEINPWIAANTTQVIQNLLDASSISEKIRLVTASTLALNSLWQLPFDPGATTQGRFELLDKTHVLVPMMTQTGEFPYVKGDGYQAFEFPLANSDLGVLVVMPDSGSFETFQTNLDAARLNAIAAALTPTQLTVRLPVTEVKTRKSLAGVLDKLAASGAFVEGEANFTGVNNAGYLFLKTLDHEAAISLQAEGPKAAGATVVAYQATKDEPPGVWSSAGLCMDSFFCGSQQNYFDPSLTLARPFLFAVRDHKTGSILVMGQVINPGGVPVPADLVLITPCVGWIDVNVLPLSQFVLTQDGLAGKSVTITGSKVTLIEDPLLADRVEINVPAYSEANGEITITADEITIRGNITMLRTVPKTFTLNASESIEIPAVTLTADQIDGRSLVASGRKIDLIDNSAITDMVEIVGGSAVPSDQALEFSGDTVRITGDLTLFKSGWSALHLDATDKITMGAVEITAGSLDFDQGTLTMGGDKVKLSGNLDAIRQGLATVNIVGNQQITFLAQGEVVQVGNDGLIITALGEQPISLPQGQVVLERMDRMESSIVALTKGTIVIPANPSVGGTVTLTAGATAP